MPGALNVFKTITADLTTTSASVYTTPIGYSTVVLLAQISNTTDEIIRVTAGHEREGKVTTLVENFRIPPNDAAGVLTGRLILQYGDSFAANASSDGSSQLLLSVLESLSN
jgi:hypothetical protein